MSMSKKKSLDEFILQSKLINGDKYDYSLSEYIDNHTKVIIICPTHGKFSVRPNDHLSKRVGCNKCNNASISKSKNFESKLIDKFNAVHHFKYDYSLAKYKGIDTKIDIICFQHGIFRQTPKHHLFGCGCQKCANVYMPTNDEFIKKSIKINGEKYDYSLVNYINNRTKIQLICPVHGEFSVTPNDHLSKKKWMSYL